jgi:hypothetical protein
MRTPTASEVEADVELIKQVSWRLESNDAAILGRGIRVHKDLRHKMSVPLSKRELRFRCGRDFVAGSLACGKSGQHDLARTYPWKYEPSTPACRFL